MVPPGHKISLRKDYDPGYRRFKDKKDARKSWSKHRRAGRVSGYSLRPGHLRAAAHLQAAGRRRQDGAIKHVMSGVNPQGCQVYSFKSPPPRAGSRLSMADQQNDAGARPDRHLQPPITRKCWWFGSTRNCWTIRKSRQRLREISGNAAMTKSTTWKSICPKMAS